MYFFEKGSEGWKGASMEQVVKGFFGIFFLLLTAFLGTQLISAAITEKNAREYLSKSVEAIENSHFSENVIERCRAAGPAGCQLKVSGELSPSGRILGGAAEVCYDYRIPLLQIRRPRTVSQVIY